MTMTEAERELQSSLLLIRQSYLSYSVVQAATRSRAFNLDTDANIHLEDIRVREVVPEEWFGKPAICPEPFFYDMGRNLAILEENYLMNTIATNSGANLEEIQAVTYESIANVINHFIESGDQELVLFIPAELSVPLYVEPEAIDFRDNMELLRIRPNLTARLFLTSKYVESKDLLLIVRNFGTWIYAQGDYDSLQIRSERMEDKIEITAGIQANYRIDNPRRSRLIRVRA